MSARFRARHLHPVDCARESEGTLDIRVRRARRTDFEVIWPATLQTVWDDLPEEERARLDHSTWEKEFRRKLMPYVEGGQTEAWIAEDPAGTLVGYLLLGETGGFLTRQRHGFVYDVWVTPERRGQGIGKFLLGWAVQWAEKKGYPKIKLEVAESNPHARNVYEAMGFRTERRYMGRRLE